MSDATNPSPIAWFGGRFLPLDEVRISPEDRGFLFADGVYEGLRHYPRRDGGGGILRLDLHLQRLRRSLEVIRLTSVDVEFLAARLPELVERNGLSERDATVYLQITRGVAPRAHAFPGARVEPTVYALAKPFAPPVRQWEEGVKVTLVDDERWGRCDVKSISLLPNVLAKQVAEDRGCWEAVLVREGHVTEGAQTAVVFARDGALWTHPPSRAVLPSVTRDLVVERAEHLGIAVVEEALAVDELGDVDEMMILGTSTEVMPVIAVDDRPVGEGTPGPMTRRLQRAYAALHG